MNKTKYYLPIKSINLVNYFSKGCVCPAKYIEKRDKDIQDEFDNHLLFSNNKFTENTNCSLEIILNDKEEEKVKKISENFFLFKTPLPISRVKEIIFKEETQKKRITDRIEKGAAFLPSKLIKVDSDSQHSKSTELVEAFKDILPSDKDWTDEIELYNRVMGGFAIMSIAGNEYQNYPLNYFKTLSIFNTLIKDEIKNKSIEVNKDYNWVFFKDNQNYPELHKAIHSKINNDKVKKFAKEDNISLLKKLGMYRLDAIKDESKTYLVAILALYGHQGTRKNLDDFISDLVSTDEFSEKRKEGIALIFGINKGYKAFRNSYKTENFKVDIKFKLDSKLDYYTIESIYQFVFNGKKDNSTFGYIDDWCPKLSPETENNKGFETYQILDKIVRYKKEEDFFEKIFKEISRDEIYNKITLEIQKRDPPYYLKGKYYLEGVKYFKNLLESSFKKYTKSIYDRIENKYSKQIEISGRENYKLKKTIKDKDDKIIKLQNEIDKLEKKDIKLPVHVKEIKPKTEDSESNIVVNEPPNRDKNVKVENDLVKKNLDANNINNKTKSHSKETEDLENKVIPKEKIIKDTKKEENKELVKDDAQTDPDPEIPFPNNEKKEESLNYKERKKLLNNEGIGELKKIAKEHKILKYSDYKKEKLIEEILKVEYPK